MNSPSASIQQKPIDRQTIHRVAFDRSASPLVAAVSMALAALPLSTNAATFVSSRVQSETGKPVTGPLPAAVPAGAVVLLGTMDSANTQTRTQTCQDIYGTPAAPLVSYSGGPWTQTRVEIGYGQYSAWTKTSGECYRNYQQTKVVTDTVCPANQTGVNTYNQLRQWTVNDEGATTSDTGYVTQSSSSTCNYYFTGSYGYENNNPGTCGTAIQQRSYQIWSDGSKRNYSSWYVIGYNAACPYYVSTQTEYMWSGLNEYSRTYQLWSDGTHRNVSSWTLIYSGGGCDCCGCSCFPSGTMVLMGDGTQLPIEQIRAGDFVMGTSGAPVMIVATEHPLLADRRMLSFDDGSMLWSEEDSLWVRHEGHEWMWVENREWWLGERAEEKVTQSHVRDGYLHDMESILGCPAAEVEFASVDGFVRRRIVEHPEFEPGTQLHFIVTEDGQGTIMNGYVTSGAWDERTYDPHDLHWEESLARMNERLAGARREGLISADPIADARAAVAGILERVRNAPPAAVPVIRLAA